MSGISPESRNLDLLRAAAVGCVLVAHLVSSLIGGPPLDDLGRVGVMLFFVHTALVLLLSLDRNRSPRIFLDFYARRFFRIYPLCATCIVAILLAQIPYVPKAPFVAPGWRELLTNLLLIQNLTHDVNLISPLWSLPLEVQMYAILPAIYLVLRRFGSAPLVLVIWAIAAAGSVLSPILAFVPCFFGGVFAYQVSKEKTFQARAALWPAALLLLLAVHAWFRSNIAADARSDFAMCMILGCLIPNFRDLGQSWLTDACHVIAKYSYGIYLFHLPIIWLAFFKLTAVPLPLRCFVFCALMCAVPWVAYRWIEAPMIAIGQRLSAGIYTGELVRDSQQAEDHRIAVG